MTKDEIEDIAASAGRAAARETLIQIGANPDRPHDMQADFAWMRRSRILSEKSWIYVVGAVLGGVATLFISHIIGWMRQ